MNRNVILLALCLILTGCATYKQCYNRLQSHQKWISQDKLYSIYQSGYKGQNYEPNDNDCNLKQIAKEMFENGYPYFIIEGTDTLEKKLWLDEKTFVAGLGAMSVGYRQRPQIKDSTKTFMLPIGRVLDSKLVYEEITNKYSPHNPCKSDIVYRECR